MPPSDNERLTAAQRKKISSIVAAAGKDAGWLILDVRCPESLPDGTVCVSLVAHIDKRGEVREARACFIEPRGRHHWR